MREALGAPIPREPLATCDRCVMAEPPARHIGEAPYRFENSVKCCTFLPVIPNFLVGGALRDEDPAAAPGRESIRMRIAAGEAVAPLGLWQTDEFLGRYDLTQPLFGRSAAVRCPHFVLESGRCGIWRYRESACATFYCKHVRGATGQAFWTALRELLHEIEDQIAWWCVGRLGLHPGAVARMLSRAGAPRDRAEASSAAWGGWTTRREEFYVRCSEEVSGFTWRHVERIFEPRLKEKLATCRAALARLADDSVPSRLRPARFAVLGRDDEVTRVTAYSRFDPQDLPNGLIGLIPAFDGRSTEEVLTKLRRDGGDVPSVAAIRRLVDFGILEADGDGDGG
jgi:hypothetical protein